MPIAPALRKDDLIAAIWNGRIVSQSALTTWRPSDQIVRALSRGAWS